VLGIKAAGHTGTLDPFATGLLIVLVGPATRLARFIEAQPKTYTATARLGVRTTTDDLTGEVVGSQSEQPIPETLLCETLAQFVGTHAQRPPQYSAKRVDGERSYRKARRGETVELAEVMVTVHEITSIAYRPPEFDFRVKVSAGTYIRAIARDVGEQLGVGAHLTRLRREAIGSLQVEDAVNLERLSPADLVPALQVLPDLPIVDLGSTDRDHVIHGRRVVDSGAAGQRGSGAAVALLSAKQLIAIARAEEGWLYPTVVLGAS
jgi:tRNA pseudouridine55 synthase